MYRFLLVEDDRNIRELIVNYFTKKEKDVFEVEIAADGQTGLEKAYENHYDLLLLDVMLPELDGFEICREIRRESDVPIMFITARADESDMLNAYALGCDDYVTGQAICRSTRTTAWLFPTKRRSSSPQESMPF